MSLPVGYFSSPFPNGRRSPEVQVLGKEPLDRTDVRQVIDRDERFVTVGTRGGQVLVLRLEDAQKLGL